MNFVIGIILGMIVMYFILGALKLVRAKKGIKYKDYGNLSFTVKLKDSIRHIIYEYSIKRRNHDFLFNIDLNGERIMQIMHRAHFPELCKEESDVFFGLALYVPVKNWSEDQRNQLEQIIEEESEVVKNVSFGKLEYYLVDLGTRVRFSGYLLSRIITEVFKGNEDEFESSLFTEGELPYIQKPV